MSFFGYKAPTCTGKRLRALLFILSDGSTQFGFLRRWGARQAYCLRRRVSVGFFTLSYVPPHLNLCWPWAWAILRQLKLRSRIGLRYRLGLPARGQRTHTNASTTGRHSNSAVRFLKANLYDKRVWQAWKQATMQKKPKQQTMSKRALKAVKHKRGVVRTRDTKKKNVWQ